MASRLESAREKVRRGAEHFDRLYNACNSFIESDPYDIEVNFEADAGCHVARLSIREHLPPDLPLILGDLVHNLRSALDHAAWQVARVEHSEKDLLRERTQISFPVKDHPNDFAALKLLDYISPQARAVFERSQPYCGSDDPARHWLMRLNRLWNADKHRLLHPALAIAPLWEATYVPYSAFMEDIEGGIELENRVRPGQGLGENAEIVHIRFRTGPRPDDQKVRVKRKPAMDVVFGTGRDTCDLRDLASFCGTTASALDRIEAAFA